MIAKRYKSILLSFALLAATGTTGLMAMKFPTTWTEIIVVPESKEARQDVNDEQKQEDGWSREAALENIRAHGQGGTDDRLGEEIYERIWDHELSLTPTAIPGILSNAAAKAINDKRLLALEFGIYKRLMQGANANWCNPDGSITLLHMAAKLGLTFCLDMLICAGANVNSLIPEYKDTPLHWAAEHGQLDCVKHLIAAGATLDARDSENCTAYHCAVRLNQPAIVEYLLEMGACPYLMDENLLRAGTFKLLVPEWSISKSMVAVILRGIQKARVRHNWMRVASLLAFIRANDDNEIRYSILPLIDHDIMPFIDPSTPQTLADTSAAAAENASSSSSSSNSSSSSSPGSSASTSNPSDEKRA
jgi:ankyrin repeat protein